MPSGLVVDNYSSSRRCNSWYDSGGVEGKANGAGSGMHANVHADRNEWRLPPDETLQVADPKAKKAEVGDEEVSTLIYIYGQWKIQ